MADCKYSCKTLTGPDKPEVTWGEVEFMYERVMPIIAPNDSDPKGFAYFHIVYGGGNPYNWQSAGKDKWTAEAALNYSLSPYRIWTIDAKVTSEYIKVARKISARPKGTSYWIELTCIVENPANGDMVAQFIFHNGQIRNPTDCSGL